MIIANTGKKMINVNCETYPNGNDRDKKVCVASRTDSSMVVSKYRVHIYPQEP